jgi:CelD/BcsL family acetyltransferase involved in cellulose biosynthesis
LSFIVAEDKKAHFISRIIEYLNNNTKWDLLYLESLDRDNKAVDVLKSCVDKRKWKWMILKEHTCFYLPLLSSFEEIEKTVSHSLIKSLRANKRKLSNKGIVEWKEIVCSSQAEVYAVVDTVISLHQKRWQLLESKIGGVFSNPLLSEFLKKVSEEFYKNGWLSVNFLSLDGRPMAADYNLKFNNKIWCYSGGFDPEYEHYSPGSICFWESLQYYINNGYREYDFLKGGEGYKNRWTDKFRKEVDILVVKAGIKGNLFLSWQKIMMRVKRIIKLILPKKLFYFFRALKFNRSR